MLVKARDGSIHDEKKIVYFSFERFMTDIVKGDNCFVCGISPAKVPFNDEHVLPDWILRRYRLSDRILHIPNRTPFCYRHLKIPCCVDCNTLLGKVFETPLSRVLTQGYEGFREDVRTKDPEYLFNWLSLIFLKTHLKDNRLRLFLDRREDDITIGHMYGWDELHHIHCISRSFYTGCKLAPSVPGSLLVLPAKVRPHFEKFDYFDLHLSQTMLLRIEDIALITSFNDAKAGSIFLKDTIDRITGPLSPIQLREIAVRIASINLHIENRPRFRSSIDMANGDCQIQAKLPNEIILRKLDDEVFGRMFFFTCKDMLPQVDDPDIPQHFKDGKWTFLFDRNGDFIRDSMEMDVEDT
jgi:hypothetical protein